MPVATKSKMARSSKGRVARPSKGPWPGRYAVTKKTVAAPEGASSEAFGLRVDGDCMAPHLRTGQVVIVDVGLPRVGELAVIWARGASRPIVKRLAEELIGFPHHPESELAHAIMLEQTNPPKRYRIWANNVERIMRVHAVVDGPQ
jgi:hypothetical protein